MTAIEHVHVRQTSDSTCGHACLSSVTGVPIQELIARFGARGLTDCDEAVVLTELGIFPQVLQPLSANNVRNLIVGWYFMIVPSLNLAGKNHRVVAFADQSGWQVFDPQEGREGRKFWPRDCMNTGAPLECEAWTEPCALTVMDGHRGNELRAELYRQRRDDGKEMAA